MTEGLPPILIPEGHEPPKPPPGRDRSTRLWLVAVLLLAAAAVTAALMLDRQADRDPPLPLPATEPAVPSGRTP
jgi:hypothetical protein